MQLTRDVSRYADAGGIGTGVGSGIRGIPGNLGGFGDRRGVEMVVVIPISKGEIRDKGRKGHGGPVAARAISLSLRGQRVGEGIGRSVF